MKFIIAVREGVDVRQSELLKWLHGLPSYQNETYGRQAS